MAEKINIEEILNEIRAGGFILNCKLPMGYTCGFPTLKINNGTLCLIIPFLKYKVTGETDKTLVFPIRYKVTVSLPDKRIVGFEDLSLNDIFARIDFNKPIGYFRHESVKKYSRKEYFKKKKELFSMYSKMAEAIVFGSEYTDDDDNEFFELLNIMLEPSQRRIYKVLDSDFYNKYLDLTEA